MAKIIELTKSGDTRYDIDFFNLFNWYKRLDRPNF
jgi:hypothetical protein